MSTFPKIGQAQSHTPAPANGSSIDLAVNVAASKTSGVIAYSRNPQRSGVIVTEVYVHIKNPSAVACDLDIGVATTNVLSDTVLDGCGVNMPINTVYSNVSSPGANGYVGRYLAAGSFITVAVASGDANGLQADVYVDYKILEGGSPSL